MGHELRRDISGLEICWDEDRAAAARADGIWRDKTIADHCREKLARDPDWVAVIDGTQEFTIGALHRDAERLARALAGRGLKPGDTISFQLPNWHEAVVIALAAAMTGLVMNPITPIYREHEVRFMLADSRSRMLFVPREFRGYDHVAMAQRAGAPEIVTVRARVPGLTSWEELLAEGEDDAALPGADPDAVKLVMYTSGTTGRAKGVIHSHNTLQSENWMRAAHLSLTERDVMYNPSPVTHVTGMLYSLCFPFTLGIRTVMADSWDPAAALEAMRRHRVTGMIASTIFLSELLGEAKRLGQSLPDLRFYLCGGAQVPPALIREASRTFVNCAVSRLYGATEVPNMTGGVNSRALLDYGAETDGELLCDVRIVEGEIHARGPQMFLGYTRADDNAAAFDADGRFCTGDLGEIVDGRFVKITGRKKDLIIRAGENISAKEIEDLLLGHPAIADIAIVAMPNARTGEAACAFVIPRAGAAIDLPDIASFLIDAGTAKQKIPERLELVDELPRTAIGKVRKDVLRERARALVAAETA